MTVTAIPPSSDARAAFIGGLIGLPWEARATGPDAFDCWGLFLHVQAQLFARHLPTFPHVDATSPRQVMDAIRGSGLQRNWQPVLQPGDGDAVLMSRRTDPAHIGLWLVINGIGGVLHAVQGYGVVWQSLAELRVGWPVIAFRRDCGAALDHLQMSSDAPTVGAVIIIVTDHLNPLQNAVKHPVQQGVSPALALAGLAGLPADYWLCLNAEPLLRHHPDTGENEWQMRQIACGDILWVISPLPAGGDDGSALLTAIASIVIAIAAPWAVGALFPGMTTATGLTFGGNMLAAGFALGANMIIGQLIPTPAGQPQLATPSPTYTLTPPGNRKRPGAMIPRIYGSMRRQPDLLADPWGEYTQNEQYYHVLLCLGHGDYQLNELGIEDTVVWRAAGGFTGAIDDVELELCHPGDMVTLFPVAVRVNAEVGGQELAAPDPTVLTPVGPFAACAPDEVMSRVVCDFVFPAGLFRLDGGTPASLAVTLRMEARAIDASGNPLGGWAYSRDVEVQSPTTVTYETRRVMTTVYDSEDRPRQIYEDVVVASEDVTLGALRLTEHMPVPPARYEVRCTRITASEAGGTGEQDGLVWAALRAHLPSEQTYPDLTLLAIRVRATATSAQASLLWYADTTALLPAFHPVSGALVTLPTEAIEAAALDVIRSPYGLAMADAQIDLAQLTALATRWRSRGDVCCIAIDTDQSAWDVLDQVLSPGRAKAQFIGNTVTFVRDEAKPVPAHLITQADMVRGSFEVERKHTRREDPNVVNLRYWDRLGRLRTVKCEPDGVITARPADVDRRGIVDMAHAWREGMYIASGNARRRRYVSFRMREAGRALVRGALVAIAHPRADYGRAARLAAIDWPILHLTAPHDLAEGQSGVMSIQSPVGGYWGPVLVRPAGRHGVEVDLADWDVVVGDFMTDPRDWMTDQDADCEATRIAIGTEQRQVLKALITELRPLADGQVEVSAMQDVPEVHDADTGTPPTDPYAAVTDLPEGLSPTTLDVFRRAIEAGAITWRGVTVSFIDADEGAGVVPRIVVAGPAMAGVTFYEASVSTDGGDTWAETVVAEAPEVTLAAPNFASLLIRYKPVIAGGAASLVIRANPFYLTPYEALFDTGTYSILGASKTLPEVMSLSRASTATYVDALGVLHTAAAHVPRFDHMMGTRALLIEPAATNVLLYSEDISNAAWTKANVGAPTTAPMASPSGGIAQLVPEASNTATHNTRQDLTITSGAPHTFFAIARENTSGSKRYLGLSLATVASATNYVTARFDLATGAVVLQTALGTGYALGSAVAYHLSDGFWLCALSGTISTATDLRARIYLAASPTAITSLSAGMQSYLGNGSGLILGGCQIVEGALSSYIPTTSAPVTRAADIPLLAGITATLDLSITYEDETVDVLPAQAVSPAYWPTLSQHRVSRIVGNA